MKTKVILIRHGETEWNVLCKFLGTVDLPLNEKGRRQVLLWQEEIVWRNRQ